MIRALIADDEDLSRRALHQMLGRHPDVEVVAECRDGAEAREALETLRPDVAFLDIRMPLESGLAVAGGRADRGRTLVVFVTAFDAFALPAFAADAADYLTKPLTEARFDEALSRVRERVRLRREADRPDDAGRYAVRLVARVGVKDVVIPVEAIDWIEADDVYAAVVSARHRGGGRHLVRIPLDTLEQTLDPREFVRIHRRYIVRIDRVTALRRRDAELLAVVAGTELPVSRRRRAAVSRLFARLPSP